jgi:hypothetical protein
LGRDSIIFDQPRRVWPISCGLCGLALAAVVIAWPEDDRALEPANARPGAAQRPAQGQAVPAEASSVFDETLPSDSAAGRAAAQGHLAPGEASSASAGKRPPDAAAGRAAFAARERPLEPRVVVEERMGGSRVTTFGVAAESVPPDVAAALSRLPEPGRQVPELGVLGMRPDTSLE